MKYWQILIVIALICMASYVGWTYVVKPHYFPDQPDILQSTGTGVFGIPFALGLGTATLIWMLITFIPTKGKELLRSA